MSNISQIQVNNTTYDIKDAVARDEKIDTSLVARKYATEIDKTNIIVHSTPHVDGLIYKATVSTSSASAPRAFQIVIGDICKPCVYATQSTLAVTDVLPESFVYVKDDNDDKIYINSISIIYAFFRTDENKWYMNLTKTAANQIDGTVQYGRITAKNDLTGIESIDDANRLLTVEKINNEYVSTYTGASMSKIYNQGADTILVGTSKGTSDIAYIRGYAVFKNDDNTETIMYTPCKLLSWEETQS